MEQICESAPPLVTEYEPSTPPALAAVIARALERRRDARFENVDAFAKALRSVPECAVPGRDRAE